MPGADEKFNLAAGYGSSVIFRNIFGYHCIVDSLNTGEYGSVKTHVLAYSMQCTSHQTR